MIPYGRQSINQLDIDAVVEVLNSDFLTQGHRVPEFEEKLASLLGIFVSSLRLEKYKIVSLASKKSPLAISDESAVI